MKYRELKVYEIRKDFTKETAAYDEYFTKMVYNSKGDSRLLRGESSLSQKTNQSNVDCEVAEKKYEKIKK